MKKLLCFVMFFAVSAVFSSAEDIKNNIKMVTYFPVPYVAYSTVQVDTAGQLDVGLTQAPAMYLGSAGITPLNVAEPGAEVNLKTGELKLDNIKYILGGNVLSLGEPSSEPSSGKLTFSKNLRINTMEAGSLVAEKPHNASEAIPFAMTVNSLDLFGKPFPPCEGEKMVWQNLKLEEATQQETYLMCGTPSTSSVCLPPEGWTKFVSCTDEWGHHDGRQRQDWIDCRYVDVGKCESQWVMCLSQLKCKGISASHVGERGLEEGKNCNPMGGPATGQCTDILPHSYNIGNYYFPTHADVNDISRHRLSDISCEPGTPCASCSLGTLYIKSENLVGDTCCEGSVNPNPVRRLRVRYAECQLVRKTKGCESLEPACNATTWSGVSGFSGGGGATITPNNPGQPAL